MPDAASARLNQGQRPCLLSVILVYVMYVSPAREQTRGNAHYGGAIDGQGSLARYQRAQQQQLAQVLLFLYSLIIRVLCELRRVLCASWQMRCAVATESRLDLLTSWQAGWPGQADLAYPFVVRHDEVVRQPTTNQLRLACLGQQQQLLRLCRYFCCCCCCRLCAPVTICAAILLLLCRLPFPFQRQ